MCLLNMAKTNEAITSGQDTRQADCFDLQGYDNKYRWHVLFFRLLCVSHASGLLSMQGCEFTCSRWVTSGEVVQDWEENTVREQLPEPCCRCYYWCRCFIILQLVVSENYRDLPVSPSWLAFRYPVPQQCNLSHILLHAGFFFSFVRESSCWCGNYWILDELFLSEVKCPMSFPLVLGTTCSDSLRAPFDSLKGTVSGTTTRSKWKAGLMSIRENSEQEESSAPELIN